MPVRIVARSEPTFLEAVFQGCVTPEELTGAAADIFAHFQELGTHLLLADCSGLAGSGHSVMDLYAMAESLSSSNAQRRFREALILPSAAVTREKPHFWETACQNRGLPVRAFTDRESALAWPSPLSPEAAGG